MMYIAGFTQRDKALLVVIVDIPVFGKVQLLKIGPLKLRGTCYENLYCASVAFHRCATMLHSVGCTLHNLAFGCCPRYKKKSLIWQWLIHILIFFYSGEIFACTRCRLNRMASFLQICFFSLVQMLTESATLRFKNNHSRILICWLHSVAVIYLCHVWLCFFKFSDCKFRW